MADYDFRPGLDLSPAEMRDLGHQVVDMIVDHFAGLRDEPVTGVATRAQTEALLREPIPRRGRQPREVLDRLKKDVFEHITHVDHPRFFAFVPSPSNYVGVMAEALAAGFNVFAGTWIECSGPATVELVTIDWMKERCGLPPEGGGLFVSGGSMANLLGLALAREVKTGRKPGRVYFSTQTHSSVVRALRVLGFEEDDMCPIEVEAGYRISLPALRDAIAADRKAGRPRIGVIANAGTTNTGAVDPLQELSGLCRNEDLWLHADGAYGAAAAFSDRGRKELPGLGLVDSLALDPHKWLFQPFETGCLLVRDFEPLRSTFRILPEYLRDIVRADDEINFCDLGVQLTRSFRALKLWMSLQVFGLDAFSAAIDNGIELAELAEARLRWSNCWEIVTPAKLGVVSFRYAGTGDDSHDHAVTEELVGLMIADGTAFLTSSVLEGQTVLRLCPINPRTTDEDVEMTIVKLEELAQQMH